MESYVHLEVMPGVSYSLLNENASEASAEF